jgi:membrane protein DedA with SNARE-associated domain
MELINKLISKLFLSNYIGGFVRTALAALSGYLIAKGIATAEQAETLNKALLDILPNIVPLIVAYISSILNKKLEATK